MSKEDIVLSLLKDIKEDSKDIKEDIVQLKLDHKEMSTSFKEHLKVYSSDKVRYNNAITYHESIKEVAEKKFQGFFDDIRSRMTEVERKQRDIEIATEKNKFVNNIQKAIYISGGSIITLGIGFLAWIAKNGATLVK